MLRTLEIRDVLIIEHLELQFQAGLNVLTGETGAGKSILLDALGFVLGWRGRAELVRAGATQGEVTAVFDLSEDHPARAVLAAIDISIEDELILRRINMVDGRKQAFVNDRRVSGEVLRDLSEHLVELHGQHDDRGLLNPRGHRVLLDSYAGVDPSAARLAWRKRTAAREALSMAEAALARAAQDDEFLRHAVAEFDKLDPKPGEEAALDTRRRLMQGAEKIRTDILRASSALSNDAAEGAMRDAQRWLEGASDRAEGRLEPALAALGRSLVELEEAQSLVDDCLRALDFNPHELDQLEERLFAIRALARKHGQPPDALESFAETLRARLTAIDGGANEIAKLQKELVQADAAYSREAAALRTARTKAAKALDIAMAAELAPLKMERAVFRTELSDGEPGPEGTDAVTFSVATNPGAPSGPLNKIASGGELSRFLLALKVCLTGGAAGLTLIFDEIDRGVGGATADAVGRRLKSLADKVQVLVVTHSPQVAALGGHHWRVEKRSKGQQTLTTVLGLDVEARVEEIARMLAGDTVTDAARAAAKSLLGA
ncbi:MAG: DNA repair protein RecN [Microgenomates group bacterium]